MTILCVVDDDRFSEPVVETAADLADAYGDELVVLHVMSRERFESRTDGQPEYYVDDGANDAANRARKIAANAGVDGDAVVPKGRVGSPADEIIDMAERLEPRYLVLGGRKRSPVGKALFGSITQSVLLEVEAPTVTLMHD
ncbi:universal stress protein [Haloterrigena alkaliphila]|uniref:Universal stress protein n=1 Tax=Haloterrigena alkaliphila TaxID=2816475 RepID=A0A8A2V754_9EURY|nr:universal stress protein [Haloterrigena alkaliphila]QSW97699.1 universal stress protein [Haloterrigena alkaliphila]